MLDYHQALTMLLQQIEPTQQKEMRPLLQATGCVLAENILTQYNSPLFDNSAMDGYALGGDITQCSSWQIVGRIAAGDTGNIPPLQTAQAARIFTGAPVPKGTTAVIQQEHTTITGTTLTLTHKVQPKQNIRYQSEELKQGEVLLPANQTLTPATIGLLASQGYAQVNTFKPLRITVFSTGNEVINPGQPLTKGKIYDANRYLLLSWLTQSNHHITDGGILPDNQQHTQTALAKAAQHTDVIITSGGVSVGEEDHVHTAIEQLGELIFWKLAIKPGKPFAWGKINKTTVFMLPGNPVASLVTFQQLLTPALATLTGIPPTASLPEQQLAKATFTISKTQNRREFLRVTLHNDESGNYVKKLPGQGSSMLATCVQANALAEIPSNTPIHEGDLLTVYPLRYKV